MGGEVVHAVSFSCLRFNVSKLEEMHPRSCLSPASATKCAAAAAAVVAAFAERVLHFQGGSCVRTESLKFHVPSTHFIKSPNINP